MHLGTNLRKAFFDSEESGVDTASSDVLVHEFCKLLEKLVKSMGYLNIVTV